MLSVAATCNKNNHEITEPMPASTNDKISMLCLGDSYTIGHSLPEEENFPNQTYILLKTDSVNITPPRIIATTGWTTDELKKGIQTADAIKPLDKKYDFVTLLIGVNNQYRGRPVENYKIEFEGLLQSALQYAGQKRDHVIVLSIPDWGVTPFANSSERERIAREIDSYNDVNRQIANQYQVQYINITPWTREAAQDPSLVASDGLHPSAKEYKRWAEKLAVIIKTINKRG